MFICACQWPDPRIVGVECWGWWWEELAGSVAHWSRGPQPGLTRSLGSLGQGRNGQLAQRPGLGSYQQCF